MPGSPTALRPCEVAEVLFFFGRRRGRKAEWEGASCVLLSPMILKSKGPCDLNTQCSGPNSVWDAWKHLT